MNYTIREIQKTEYPLLDNFLYEAIFIPEGIDPPPKTIISSHELQVYVEHFGELIVRENEEEYIMVNYL